MIPFKLPSPQGYTEEPVWNGREFVSQAASTRSSALMELLVKIEVNLLSGMSLLFGVRVTMTVIK
ncbi:hypothetical protein CCGE525_26895 (plasmid) [Rhizobium jaguaris]|uniref:Uncharacterized protein n=1 Tax=Rhizobium jaguaris TaxID=1312183 RepID=A0A387G328_9HYPH|nr:hypothetical protein CCGE525_26895 [Rhizobium jaguaris]